MRNDLKVPQRVIDPDLKVPLPIGKPLPKKPANSEEDVLKVLAENYRVNPGLHMTMEDIREWLEVSGENLVKLLEGLEKQGYAGLYRTRKGISLARVTYKGLQKANPPEHYRYFPSWADPQDCW